MNVLLVNCYTEKKEEKIRGYAEFLRQAAAGMDVEIEIREDSLVSEVTTAASHDAVVLSGSHRMVSQNQFFWPLLDFLQKQEKPLLGICYGHQVLARAFGARVEKDTRSHKGDEEVWLKKADPLFEGFPPRFPMSESHEEVVLLDQALLAHFEILALSGEGKVEAVRHRKRPLWGVQFHPERSGEPGVKLFANFLSQINSRGNS